jgi:2-C-methyl-D-erythritol 4-phosphate cytidylyltransferase
MNQMISAIVVAAGKGKRMGGDSPKQYLPLVNRPILCHTLAAIHSCGSIDRIILVLAEQDYSFCRENILAPLDLEEKVQLVPGGETRQESVYNGLQSIEENNGIVVIHDGVRPFVRPEEIEACITSAAESGACILGIPVHNTLKQVDATGHIKKTTPRNSVWQAQTPQCFQLSLIKKAHVAAKRDGYSGSDDALLVERLGKPVNIIDGSRYNIKITTQEDLLLARAVIGSGIFEVF